MKKEKKLPDNVVYSKDKGYFANILPYGTNLGAPKITPDNIAGWKQIGVQKINKEFELKFNELREQYHKLMEEFEWNEIIYNSKFTFEPVIGEIYHLYLKDDGFYFLSLIPPDQWNKEHIGTFKINSDKKWEKLI